LPVSGSSTGSGRLSHRITEMTPRRPETPNPYRVDMVDWR
jgi:hypothetical protein